MATIWLLLITIVVVLLVYLGSKLLKSTHATIKTLEKVPGLPRHWLFGTAKELTCWSDFFLRMQKLFVDKGEKMYVFWVFNLPVITMTHPDTVKDIMRSSEPKGTGIQGYGGLIPWLGHSLLTSSGTKWERNRRLLTPAFHFDILKPYVKVFNSVTDILIEKMAKAAKEGKRFEIFKPAGLATLDSLLRCALSYEGNIQQTGNVHHYCDTIYKLFSDGREFYKHCDYVHDFSAKIISERRTSLKEDPDVLKKRHLDCLDILLTAKDSEGQGLTDEEIRDEVDTFMFAGHDTTATALSWSMYALGKYQKYQSKLYEEVRRVLGDRQTVEWEDIAKLKYLSCFTKEVMRMYTPVPVISRLLSKPLTIEGVTIPAGTPVNLGLYHIHHHPDIWHKPYEFNPERFESEDILNKDPFSFVPFSAGPRKCIGQNFALNEAKVMIARIVNRFEVGLDPDHKVEPFIDTVLRTKTGIYIKLNDR